MVALSYVGRTPDSDATLVPKSYVDAQTAAQAVTTGWVTDTTTTAIAQSGLATPAYVTNVLGTGSGLAQKTYTDAQDRLYAPVGSLGQPSGVASLDSGGNLTAAQIPSGTRTDRVARCVTGTILTSTYQTVTSTTLRSLKLATVQIPSPGYSWVPLIFAWVPGNSGGAGTPGSRQAGNGNFGLLTVMPPAPSTQIYAMGAATASIATDYYPVLPYATQNQTPTTVGPISGALQLDLWGCCWSGGLSYTFGPPLSFFVMVYPAA